MKLDSKYNLKHAKTRGPCRDCGNTLWFDLWNCWVCTSCRKCHGKDTGEEKENPNPVDSAESYAIVREHLDKLADKMIDENPYGALYISPYTVKKLIRESEK